jgi:hypothetical protein
MNGPPEDEETRSSTHVDTGAPHTVRKWHKKGSHPPGTRILLQDGLEEDDGDQPGHVGLEQKRKDTEKERAILQGMIEKKTYIGLVSCNPPVRPSKS